MKIMHVLYGLGLFILLWPRMAYNQVRQLRIGDTLPDLEVKMLQYKKDRMHLQETRGRFLILHFWTPSCSVSSGQLKRLEALQEKFKDSPLILPVSFDGHTPGSVKAYLEKLKDRGQKSGLPCVLQEVQDTLLMKWFPFMGLPFEIWVDKKGIIQAMTDHLSLTGENILSFTRGEKLNLPLKYVDSNFDMWKPLFLNSNGNVGNAFTYRSLLMPYEPNIQLPGIYTSDAGFSRIAISNETPLNLIKNAIANYYGGSFKKEIEADAFNKRVMVRTSNKFFEKGLSLSDLPPAQQLEFAKANLFCYELLLPGSFDLKEAYQVMWENICSFFRVKASVQRIKIPCLWLVKVDRGAPVQTTGKPEKEEVSEDYLAYTFQNSPISKITGYLNACLDVPVIKDSTNYLGKADLHLQLSNRSELTVLKRQLNRYGFDIREGWCEEEVIVIEDR